MKLIKFIFNENKCYRDNKHISKKKAKEELGEYRFNKLITEGKCNIRQKPVEVVDKLIEIKDDVIEEIKQPTIIKEDVKPLTKSQLKQIAKVRDLYFTEEIYYIRKGYQKELWRKNKKYGYNNFVATLDNFDEDLINREILKDIKRQNEEASKEYKTTF